MVNNGSKPLWALFFETLILDTFLAPICLHFGSILAPFGTLGPPKVRFFAFWGARARTFAHSARAGAILRGFGCPRGGPKVSRRLRRGPCCGEVKLHVAPLDGDIV